MTPFYPSSITQYPSISTHIHLSAATAYPELYHTLPISQNEVFIKFTLIIRLDVTVHSVLITPFSVTRFAVIKIVPAIISVSEKYFISGAFAGVLDILSSQKSAL